MVAVLFISFISSFIDLSWCNQVLHQTGRISAVQVPLQAAVQSGVEPSLLPSTGFCLDCTDPEAVNNNNNRTMIKRQLNPNIVKNNISVFPTLCGASANFGVVAYVRCSGSILGSRFALQSWIYCGYWWRWKVLSSNLDKDREDEGFGCQGFIGSIWGAGQMWLDNGAVLVVAIVTEQGWRRAGGGSWGQSGGVAVETGSRVNLTFAWESLVQMSWW